MSWFDVRWKALVSGDLLNTLSVIISPVKKFLEPWSWEIPEKLTKTQKFRKSQLGLKNKIWGIFQLQVALKIFYGWYDNVQGIQKVALDQGFPAQ